MALVIYAGGDGLYLAEGKRVFRNGKASVDALFTSEDPQGLAREWIKQGVSEELEISDTLSWKPVIGSQEVWASGVTYFRSRTARMEEAEPAGGEVFYDMVYEAERPELFFKATAQRVRGHRDPVCIRRDSTWDVPEPELTLAINHKRRIFGYTIGNDMSSRSIEGENPLYLPQAKMYAGSCSLGPGLVVGDLPKKDSGISISIERGGREVFAGSTEIGQIKRSFEELVAFLFRSNTFPAGAYLMTGTGVVPDASFTLAAGDVVSISIDGAGTLTNPVEVV